MEFQLDDENAILKEAFLENDNYLVELNDSKNKNCVVFFSGNGLYYPNTLETFTDVIIRKNRFEWEHIAKAREIQEHFSKMIFVRDLYKTWYVCGINKEINSVDKLIELLTELTKGYNVTTCGNSAGGYIATIVGMALKAEKVMNFGGQWDISDKESFFIRKYQNIINISKYYSLIETGLAKNIFWFYSALCDYDRKELKLIEKNINRISAIAIKSSFHGDLLLSPCYASCLIKDTEELRKISEKYAGKIVSQRKICSDFLKGKQLWLTRINNIIDSHKSLYTIRDMMYSLLKCRK